MTNNEKRGKFIASTGNSFRFSDLNIKKVVCTNGYEISANTSGFTLNNNVNGNDTTCEIKITF